MYLESQKVNPLRISDKNTSYFTTFKSEMVPNTSRNSTTEIGQLKNPVVTKNLNAPPDQGVIKSSPDHRAVNNSNIHVSCIFALHNILQRHP